MARSGFIRLFLIIFFSNEYASALAEGYGGDRDRDGGGFDFSYVGASTSSSVGDNGYSGTGNNVFVQRNQQPERIPLLSPKGANHRSGQGDLSVSVHKEVNLNGIKEGVHSLLAGILGGVSQFGDAFAQGGGHPSTGSDVGGCLNKKCHNPSGSIANIASAFSSSGFVGFQSSSFGPKNEGKYHHNFSPKLSNGPQIREQPNNGHSGGDISIGSTYGIHNVVGQKHEANNVQNAYGTPHEDKNGAHILPSIVIHKELSYGVNGNPTGTADGFMGGDANVGFNAGKKEITATDNLSKENKRMNGNFGGNECTLGSCGGSYVHSGSFNGGLKSEPQIVGAQASSVGMGLGNIVLGLGQENTSKKAGCSNKSCDIGRSQGHYSYNYSYGGSSSYASSYATSYSSASSGSHGR